MEFCKLVEQFAYCIVNLLLECGELSFYFFLELWREVCGKVKESRYLVGKGEFGSFWCSCLLFLGEVFIQEVGCGNGKVGTYFFQNGAFGYPSLVKVSREGYLMDAELVGNFTVK